MKLFKSKKSSTGITTSCISSKVGGKSNNNTPNYQDDKSETTSAASTATPTTNGGLSQVSRAMSPAQSEDSGLAADRGTTYATISIPRQNAQALGLIFSERTILEYPPVIESISGDSGDFLAPGDRIHQINGISTIGLTNDQVLNILMCHRDENAVIEIEYSLPDYLSQNSLYVTTKLAQVTVERENGCLGLTLRGGSDLPIIVTNIRVNGPVYKTGRIKPGDRVLRVDNISLIHKSLTEAQQILKCGQSSDYCNLTIEYEVSVMQTVEFTMGPLLIEIERSINEQLGLILSNYMPLASDYSRMEELQPCGIFISSILPASIGDRCGALSVGDQILSVDETVVENTSFTPEEITSLLNANCTKGYTQIQILPAHALLRRKGLQCTSPKYGGFNTVDPRKTPKMSHHKKFFRKSSLDNNTMGLTRSERIQVVLDCTHGSGLCLTMSPQTGSGFVVSKILNESVSERSGCIQKGDRIVSVNKLYNLDINLIRQILRDAACTMQQSQIIPGTAHWVELEVEFEMVSDETARGLFNVKLMKASRNAGLGITVNGSSHGAFVVTDVKPGSPAHRGSIKVGDVVLAIDSIPIQHYNVDVLLKENKNECVTLTIKRNSIPDFLYDTQNHQNNVTYANYDVSTNTFGGYKYSGYGRSSESPMQMKNDHQNNTDFSEEPHYQIAPAPRYWNGLKSNNNHDDDLMVNSVTSGDIFSYNNVDYATTQQKIMSLSIGSSMTPQSETPIPMSSFQHPHQHFQYNNYNLMNNNPNNMTSSFMIKNEPKIFSVQLYPNNGPLGITLAGNEDGQKPIVISGLQDGGVAFNTGQIQIGDTLLAINDESVVEMPLSNATKLLQVQNDVIELRLSRNVSNQMTNSVISLGDKLPQPQALYAKVQRRPNAATAADIISNSSSGRSGAGSSGSDNQFKTMHVTLFKDQVYDDYGFSVSDGLYERGVYINRIRTGGPADIVHVLKPYDRIVQVNGTKTLDFDCCLTVPLIAASGDKIDLIIQRGLLD